MQLAYGSSLFAVNSVEIVDRRETLWNSGGQPYAQRKTFDVRGYIYGVDQPSISLAMAQLQIALGVPYQNLILYQDNGLASATLLQSAGSITGVQVTRGPSFPKNEGAEYATQRYFEFTAEATYPLGGSANLLLSFTETLSFWGGGPVYRHRLAINGPPQKQLVYPQSVYHCIQTGEALGYRAYPPVQAPKFPGALIEAGKVNRKSPKRMGSGHQEYPAAWEYKFESIGPLVSDPAVWI